MTTIAFKNGILAADRQAEWGFVHEVTKIRRLSDGSLAGGSGEVTFVNAVLAWLDAGADPAKFPAHQAHVDDWQPVLVVSPEGMIQVYERTPYPVVSRSPYFAIGSGKQFAMMAMRLGRSAPEAVQLASEFDSGTGSEVDTLTLPNALKVWREQHSPYPHAGPALAGRQDMLQRQANQGLMQLQQSNK